MLTMSGLCALQKVGLEAVDGSVSSGFASQHLCPELGIYQVISILNLS